MDAGKVIAAMMGALLILFCVVASILFLIPLYQKIQLDQICRDYSYRINSTEGMNIEMRNDLVGQLTSQGLNEVIIQCPEEGALKRRERRKFLVTGTLKLRLPSGFLVINTQVAEYEFEGWVYGKRIIN